MKFLPHLITMSAAALLSLHCSLSAQDRSVGISLAFNEFSVTYRMPVHDNETLRLCMNLDMNRVITGDSRYPGVSADAVYLFTIAQKDYQSGESLRFFAGPGANVGYVRNTEGRYGILAAIMGCVGIEYSFNVPVVLSLSLEPYIGIHANKMPYLPMRLDFHKASLINSLYPHLGISYYF